MSCLMKIAYFTKYSKRGASSRLRSYQFIPELKRLGYEIEVFPLFNDKHLNILYSGKFSLTNLLICYAKRIWSLFFINRFNVLIVEKEIFPYLPPMAEAILVKIGKKIIVDYDDAIFHNYDLSSNRFIRFALKDKIDYVMKHSTVVMAGNSYLFERAKKAQAKKIEILPTVVDLNRYNKKVNYNNDKVFTIGWIGTPKTSKYLQALESVFLKLSVNFVFRLKLIGAKGEFNKINHLVDFVEWSENTEVETMLTFDVGIMPLNDTPWEKGKCAYKLIQYMACGLPVIASAIGTNINIVKPGVNGFLCSNEEDWYNAFIFYFTETELIERHGRAGRHMVEEKYTLRHNLDIITKVLKDI